MNSGVKLSEFTEKLEEINGTERILISDGSGINKYIDTSQLATRKQLEEKSGKNEIPDVSGFITESNADGKYQSKGNYSYIEYIEGTSDDEGYITSEIAPENSLIIARMYLHPTLNMWCHCPSYETTTDGDKILTGGIKYGVSIVVGGVTCQKFPNCKYRVYFIRN